MSIYEDILRERQRQDDKWGAERELSYPIWSTILTEEVGEVAQEALSAHFANDDYSEYLSRLRKELIQVAAVAVAIVEAVDRELA